MTRLDCQHCYKLVRDWGRNRGRFDWLPVEVWDGKGRRIERVHGFSRFNGRSLCGRQQR